MTRATRDPLAEKLARMSMELHHQADLRKQTDPKASRQLRRFANICGQAWRRIEYLEERAEAQA
jgi:hypothetical protein